MPPTRGLGAGDASARAGAGSDSISSAVCIASLYSSEFSGLEFVSALGSSAKGFSGRNFASVFLRGIHQHFCSASNVVTKRLALLKGRATTAVAIGCVRSFWRGGVHQLER